MLERVNLNNFDLQKMIVIVFIICLTVFSFFAFNNSREKSRDVKRKADLQILMQALDLYHDKHGAYPESADDAQGWDVSYAAGSKAADFLPVLKQENYVDRGVSDPLNNDKFFYRYKKYPAGVFGCSKPFYILQIINFETQIEGRGMGKCNNFNWTKLAPYGYTLQGYD